MYKWGASLLGLPRAFGCHFEKDGTRERVRRTGASITRQEIETEQ